MPKKCLFIICSLLLGFAPNAQELDNPTTPEFRWELGQIRGPEELSFVFESPPPASTSEPQADTLLLYQTTSETYEHETDSWVGWYQFGYSYNAFKRLETVEQRLWDQETSDWAAARWDRYEYDAQGNETQWEKYTWDGSLKEWIERNKTERFYDHRNNLITKIDYTSFNRSREWTPQDRTDYRYDDLGQQLLYQRQEWNPFERALYTVLVDSSVYEQTNKVFNERYQFRRMDNFGFGARKYLTYDSLGYQTNSTVLAFDNDLQDWVPDYVITSHYSEDYTYQVDTIHRSREEANITIDLAEFHYLDGSTVEVTNYIQVGDGYQPTGKGKYTYNENGQITSQMNWDWSDELQALENDLLANWDYNEEGESTLYELYRWSSTDEAWYGTQRQTLEYGDSVHTKYTRYTWQSDHWENELQKSWICNERGDLIIDVSEEWDAATASWIGTSRNEQFYDEQFYKIRSENFLWNDSLSIWEICYRTFFKYLPKKLPQDLTGELNSTLVYGDTLLLSPYITASSDLAVDFRSLVDSTGMLLNDSLIAVGAGTIQIIASQPGNDTYEPAWEAQYELSVSKAPLQIIADDQEIVAGDPLPELTFTLKGLLFDDSEGSLTLPELTPEVSTTDIPGIYDLYFGEVTDQKNYVLEAVDGQLTINEVVLGEQDLPQLIYPNPLQNVLYFEQGVSEIGIMDQQGRLLERHATAGLESLDLTHLENGVYFLLLQSKEELLVRKLIKK